MQPMKIRIDQDKRSLIISTWNLRGISGVMFNVVKNGVDHSIVLSMDELMNIEEFIGDVLYAAEMEVAA